MAPADGQDEEVHHCKKKEKETEHFSRRTVGRFDIVVLNAEVT